MRYNHTLADELEHFIEICQRYDKLYIYGAAHNQKMLSKYLCACGLRVEDFVTSDTIEHVSFSADSAVILGLSDMYYNEIYARVANKNVLFLSERAKLTIAFKVSPRKTEEYNIEINLADHCNLNCQMCDHFSQLVKKPYFIDIAEFKRDIERLSELSGGRLGTIKLLGGEPLLNPRVTDCLKIARQYFEDTHIWLYTNGLLLLHPQTEDFWRACKEHRVTVVVTRYPINIDVDAIKRKAFESGVELECLADVGNRAYVGSKYSVRYKLNIERARNQYCFVDCYQMNQCNVLREGKIYACPMSAYVHYFNEYFGEHFSLTDKDYIDIHKIQSFDEIAEFAARPVPFCGYCDIRGRELYPWKQSEKIADEYV